LKIGLDYRTALVNREGIGRVTRELARGLVESGHGPDLRLFAWTMAPSKFARNELGLAGSGARTSRVRFPSRWIPKLCRAVGRGADDWLGGCDVFHHTQTHVLPVRAAAEVATIYDCIYLRSSGSISDEAAETMTNAARELVSRARRIVVISSFVARDVVASLGADPARVHVALLGCDHVTRGEPPVDEALPRRSIHSNGVGSGERFALTVSRVDGRKNHVRMLRAFERLSAAGSLDRWIVVGPDGHGHAEFDAAVAASPARDRVDRRREVDDAELRRLYRATSLFLFASLEEGFGLPPLEALASGAPVVAGDNSSMPEVLGDAALLVDARDEDAIHDAARRILSDDDLRAELRRRGLARARAFTWQACARATFEAYRAAVEDARGATRA